MRNKRKKFVELAEKRVTKALKCIELVGNLSNKSNYEYSDEDAQKILRAMEGALRDMKRRFIDSDVAVEKKFSLTD